MGVFLLKWGDGDGGNFKVEIQFGIFAEVYKIVCNHVKVIPYVFWEGLIIKGDENVIRAALARTAMIENSVTDSGSWH